MSSMVGSQAVVVATAMAVSGTVLLLALRLQKSSITTQFPVHQISQSSPPVLRPCISSESKRREKKKKKKNKRVHFADDVIDSGKDGEEFRRQQFVAMNSAHLTQQNPKKQKDANGNGGSDIRVMPANRVALYNGILKDRVAQRLAYSY